MKPDLPLSPEESEEAFLLRRAAEERDRMTRTSCVVRALHEDLAEEYEERLKSDAAQAAELVALAATIKP